MAYQELGDVSIVVLGGTNKETGKKNPTELEGYFLRKEERPNRFNPVKPQAFYVFQTEDGEKGIFGKAGIDREMKKASVGVMTKVVDTGTILDTGKGNPMKVFKVYQDKSNAIEVAEAEEAVASYDDTVVDEEDDEQELDVVIPTRPIAAKAAASTISPARQAQVQALLNKARAKS